MKNKLRSITVRQLEFSYVINSAIQGEACTMELKVFRRSSKLHPLLIQIKTWDDPIAGCPLNSGFILRNSITGEEAAYNLNHPKRVREWIEYGIECGWDGTQAIEIKDGLDVMQKMGYDAARLAHKVQLSTS
jgi:hypothetical protein